MKTCLKKMKKAVALFVAVACISISALSAMQEKKIEASQISMGLGYMAGVTEGGTSGVFVAASSIAGGYATGVGSALSYTWYVSGTNPAGWVGWTTVGVAAL